MQKQVFEQEKQNKLRFSSSLYSRPVALKGSIRAALPSKTGGLLFTLVHMSKKVAFPTRIGVQAVHKSKNLSFRLSVYMLFSLAAESRFGLVRFSRRRSCLPHHLVHCLRRCVTFPEAMMVIFWVAREIVV